MDCVVVAPCRAGALRFAADALEVMQLFVRGLDVGGGDEGGGVGVD